MRKTIVIGVIGLALVANRAAAQTAGEQAQILRDFQQSVVNYAQQRNDLSLFPEAVPAATPAPKVFTPPVAVVFRQVIARALAPHDGVAIGGIRAAHQAVVMQPLSASNLFEFPPKLSSALPVLPAPLEYRLIDRDLVIRDTQLDVVIAVLRDALGTVTTKR
jgi:hypothetical protein